MVEMAARRGEAPAMPLFMDRVYCRYFCAHEAMFGLFGVFRVLTIKRDEHKCVGCGKCTRSCPMGVEVAVANNVRDPHCVNCFSCVSACPVPDALKLGCALPSRVDAAALKKKYLSTGSEVATPK